MRTIVLSLAVVLASFAAQDAHAQRQKGGAGCCSDNVCQLQKTTIKKKVICYGCKCEDFCVPGKSSTCRDGLCGCSCKSKDRCGCKGKCSCGCDHAPYCKVCVKEWTPGCATLMTRKKLVKYEKTVEVPGWKWVVVKGGKGGADCGCAKGSCGCAALTKPAPAGAMIGQSFPASDEEIKLVSASLPIETQPQAPAKKKGFKSIFESLLK